MPAAEPRSLSSLRAGVVGTGFVGVVHVHALRLLGQDVAGVVGSSPAAAAHTFLPAGHAEGWVETFRELYRSVYAAVAAGAPLAAPDYPTFVDRHRANVLGDAIALSDAERRWVEVPT